MTKGVFYRSSIDVYLFTLYFSVDPSMMRLEDKCLLLPFYFNVDKDSIKNKHIKLMNRCNREVNTYQINKIQIQNTIYHAIWVRGNKCISCNLDIIIKNMRFDDSDVRTWNLYQKYNYETAVMYNANILLKFKERYGINLHYDMDDFLEFSTYYNDNKNTMKLN